MIKLIIFSLMTLSVFAQPRVIALSPSINEIIFSLGEGQSIVGNTKFCNYPPEAKGITKVGGYFSVSLEKVISLNPDMIMLQNYDQKLLSKLKQIRMKTLLLKVDTLEDIKTSIFKIGQFYQKEKEANHIVSNINEALKQTQGIVKNKRILMVISPSLNLNKQIYIVGHNLYLEEIIMYSGNKNAYFNDFKGQPVLNMENILGLNPEVIILLSPYLDTQNITKEALINTWAKLPITAAKNKNIYVIDKEYAGIPSHRVELFLKDFKRILQDVKNK